MRGHPGAGLYGPWALADVAWVSLTRGNEYRGRPATDADLKEILNYYFALDEPMRREPVGQRLEGFLLRLAGQQLVWQEPEFPELARTLALLQQTAPTKHLEVIEPGWDKRLLGCSLADYVGVAQLLFGAATTMKGRFDPQWLASDLDDFEDLTTPDNLAAVIDRHFATSAERLRDEEVAAAALARADGKPALDPVLRRFSYNPLRGKPVVTGYGPGSLVPVPAAVVAKASCSGLYYTGLEGLGTAFTRDLGELFEQYIGRQLRLLPDADVHPEVVYIENKSERKSVDWFVVFDDLVLLVEVKSGLQLRLGPKDFATELSKKLEKALKQIDRTVALVKEGRTEFAHIPVDRPILGMVVTMDVYHMVNSPEFRSALPETTVPATITAIGELEDAVTVTDASLSTILLDGARSASPGGWWLRADLAGHDTVAWNPILDEAWIAYPLAKPEGEPSVQS
ncbi:hypothetical protein ABZ468_55280 [Streptomyces sp. NPDC005708]|uniref:hypothetical protein n=1 Tax=Streptomyces sp. NPDC005708 TaxID=3154564 RepID=UPI0033F18D7A